MNNREEVLLSVRNLSVEYTSDGDVVHAVNGVSFDLKRGEVLGLVGETGAGKTTLARALLRVLRKPAGRISGGEILFKGEDLVKKSEVEMHHIRGAEISMIFTDPAAALNPTRTVGSQIAEVLMLHQKLPKREAEQQAAELLQLVGISADRYQEYPYQFSLGMKQRVVIAIAVACSPDLLVADEPTTNLDVTIQAQILDMISGLLEQKNASMVLITHDLGIVAETCSKVAVIYAGEIVEYGTLEEIFDNAQHPYTLGLFAALPSMTDENERLCPIGGLPPDLCNLPVGCKFSSRCPYATADCRKEVAVAMVHLGGEHYCRCAHVRAGGDP